MAVMKCLFLFASIPLISCRQIDVLPLEIIKAYLNDDSPSDYEVVSLVHTLHKRSLPSIVRIRAFQKDIELYLEPNENFLFGANTPVYLAYKGANNSIIHKPFIHKKLALYHDVKNKAALVVETKGNKHLMYGTIGDYMIRPLTEKNQSSMRNKRSSASENILTAKDDEIFADDHVLIKMNRSPGVILEERRMRLKKANRFLRSITVPTKSRKKTKTMKKNRIYPEILVAADYKYFKQMGGNVSEFVKYQAVFWNGVDLLFRYFENPEIRLNIAGIIIPQKLSANYIPRKYYRHNKLNVDGFLNSFEDESTIYDDYFPKISYDIVVALTNYTLTDDLTKPVDTKTITTGMAVMKGACTSSGITVVHDPIPFEGVTTAAHEIGHLFGANHDFDEECENYVSEADYMMSYDSLTENQMRWSACSLEYMNDFFESEESKCLRNEPIKVTSPYSKYLPGKYTNLEAQCDNIKPGSRVLTPQENNGRSVCHELRCGIIKGKRLIKNKFTRGALEGSLCENGGVCLQGECVPMPKNYNLF